MFGTEGNLDMIKKKVLKVKVKTKSKSKLNSKIKARNPANWYSDDRLLNDEKVLGITADNQNIDYLGLRCLMKPNTFLKLVDTNPHDLQDKNLDYIIKRMENHKPIAHPFLKIMIPDTWPKTNNKISGGFIKSNDPCYVYTHEGRHRILAFLLIYENIPTEVLLFFKGEKGKEIRNRHIDSNFERNLLQNGIYSEFNQKLIENPVIDLIKASQ